ncbi:MAG TPA: DNA-binding protein [Candidatus Enterenecus stercoripullorum]|nr:DNA-binding protein [Candidatus Enterenecus stercoripullorum]
MSGLCIGFDTSNYTTSTAVFDGARGENRGRLLTVEQGALGLRQSEALFQHVKRLHLMVEQLREEGQMGQIAAVGASTRPREVEGSYMPCFLVGEGQGRTLAAALGVPFFPCSHQQGHIAAAAWSAGREDLLDAPHLAWHLSGGTTELLYVRSSGHLMEAQLIGGTQDISAGQLVDRIGVAMGIPFPAGKGMDALSCQSQREDFFPVKTKDGQFSLSGMENKIRGMLEQGAEKPDVARFTLETIASVLIRTTAWARERYGDLPLLCSGGVASNTLLRQRLEGLGAVFAPPQYSVDNALGVAILAHRALERGAQG